MAVLVSSGDSGGGEGWGDLLLHHVVMVVPVYDVRRGEELFLDWRGRWSGSLGFGFEEVRYIKGYEVGHQGSLDKAS